MTYKKIELMIRSHVEILGITKNEIWKNNHFKTKKNTSKDKLFLIKYRESNPKIHSFLQQQSQSRIDLFEFHLRSAKGVCPSILYIFF